MSPVEDPAYLDGFTFASAWRRTASAVWGLEKAFRRVREEDRLVDDSKLRIFLVLSLFALAFAFVGVEAGR